MNARLLNDNDRAAAIAAAIALLVFAQVIPLPAWPDWAAMVAPQETGKTAPDHVGNGHVATGEGDLIVAGYVGNPIYYRSNVSLKRSDGTDLHLYGLGWDGDVLYPPIDGGVRVVRWSDRFGTMVDFLHNKAVSRLGRGAHGRRLKYPVVEEVPASGTFKGEPAPGRIKLTEIFDRFEFTHGHNMLFFTGLMRLASPIARVRPYVGLGGGFAIPHTEIRFAGEGKADRTSEYQFAGPAAQTLLGAEIKVGRISVFVEYKFSYAWISGAITSEQSWKNWDMPGDLWRQFRRAWSGEDPRRGTFSTTLGAHQFIIGAGYRWDGKPRP